MRPLVCILKFMQRTVRIAISSSKDLKDTLEAFRSVQQDVSNIYFEAGRRLSAVDLHHLSYGRVQGRLRSQMVCTAIRTVASAYSKAYRDGKPPKKPVVFSRKSAIFLIGKAKRDAGFKKDGSLSLWTVNGRKSVDHSVPDIFKPMMDAADEIVSLGLIEEGGKIRGTLTILLSDPKEIGSLPVGVIVGLMGDVVAVDHSGRSMIVSGTANSVMTKSAARLFKRLLTKLAAKDGDTRSLRRAIKRLELKHNRRVDLFCRQAASYLVKWCPKQSVIVLEEEGSPLTVALKKAVEDKCRLMGIKVESYDTSDIWIKCNRCGLRGELTKDNIECENCGATDLIDRNAAINLRTRFTALRGCGLPSTSPDAPTRG